MVIPARDIPVNVDPGEYINLSPVSKKWSFILNVSVAISKTEESDGLNCFWNIGIELDCSGKLVLLDLSPFFASYCVTDNDSVTVPYCKSGGTFSASLVV